MKKVFVFSHERSGTHFLLNTLAFNFGYDPQQIDLLSDADLQKAIQDPQSTKPYKSHHQYYYILPHVREVLESGIVFYILRDCRDTMVSSWYYHKAVSARKGNRFFPYFEKFSDWLRADPTQYGFDQPYSIRTSRNMIERWKAHMESWVDKTFVNVIRYEDLSKRFNKTVESIGKVLGIQVDQVHKPTLWNSRVMNRRKGIVGDWENEFSKEDLELYREVMCSSRF